MVSDPGALKQIMGNTETFVRSDHHQQIVFSVFGHKNVFYVQSMCPRSVLFREGFKKGFSTMNNLGTKNAPFSEDNPGPILRIEEINEVTTSSQKKKLP